MAEGDKDIWRQRWLGCINELTSYKLQEKSWLDNLQTNPHWSFVEFMCSYFDDLVIDDNYKDPLEKGWIAKQEFEIIINWHIDLDTYNSPNNNDYDNKAILNDPKWLRILQTGESAKSKLAEILNDCERKRLMEEINYLLYIK